MIRSVHDMIESFNTQAVVPQTIEYHNWEERDKEIDLPKTTLIGLDGFSFDENDGLWVIRVALAISSYLDANLLREIELLGKIHEYFGKNKKVALLNLTTGAAVGELVVTDFRLMPMAQSEIRNYRTIGLELNRTGA
jgi:hypothetical protein